MSDKKANKNLGLCPTECRVDTWRSEELSDSPGCRKKFVFLWSNIHLNFLRKGQYTTYLSLKNCSTLSYRNTESSHRLPTGSSPVRTFNLHPSVSQTSHLTTEGVPSTLVHSSQVSIVTVYLGSRFNAGPHIKYAMRLLKPHQCATMSSIGVKVGPTFRTPDTMRSSI